jgi:branched-chain amino acid transport system permease protein
MQASVGTPQRLLDGLVGSTDQLVLASELLGFLSVQNILDGLTVGMVYVLLAAGLSVIFGVMHVINFAHGELFALGAYFAIVVSAPFGDSTGFYVALFVAPLLVGVVGVALERYTVQPLYDRNPLYHILLTFGLVLVINDLIFLIWGTGPRIIERPELITGTFELFGTAFSSYALFILTFGTAITLSVWWLLTKTRYGLIIRAGAQDRQMVRNLGISIDRYYSLVFGVGAALAAVAGIIIAGRSQVTPTMGYSIIISAFVIVVLGGLGSFRGAVVGGLGVGVLQESLLRPFVPQLEGMVIFVLMIGVLLVRPRGLFGSELEEEGGKLLTGTSGGLLTETQRFRLGLGALGLLAILPLTAGRLVPAFYVEFLVVRILIWGLFALALDFVMGYTGLVSLGHALFWGIGAYVSGTILFNFTESALVAAGVAVLIGAAVAWVVGYLSIRVHGVYFAMITLAFAELFHTSLTRIDGWAVGICETVPGCNPQTVADIQFTGGSEGLFGFSSYYGIGGVGIRLDEIGVFLGPITLTDQLLFYYIAFGVLIVSFFVTRQILKSPFGAVLKGIRENEQRVRFLGYDPTVYKRRAFTISGTFATLAGVLFALDTSFVSPEAAEWLKSGEVIVMVILGGMGTLFGPIIGSFTFFGLEELIQEGFLIAPVEWLFSLIGMSGAVPDISDRWRLVLGTLFVFFVIFLPRGIVSIPEKVQSVTRRVRDRSGGATEKVPGGDD